jgi:sulfopyruvate decarboxylase subunit beta
VYCPEEDLIRIMKGCGVDFLCTLPCDRVGNLIALTDRSFFRLPLTREEEGAGICAGAALAGKRPAMIVQSSGVGNMINALLSLTQFYELPLALFISQRGVYKEGIPAQVPMGQALPKVLEAAGIACSVIDAQHKIAGIAADLEAVYREEKVHAFLLSPALWEGSELTMESSRERCRCEPVELAPRRESLRPSFTRHQILEILRPVLEGQVVICNLGIPSKELHAIVPQPSNFYMLGSMGMATPIGLGVSLATARRVFVVDGDGSPLMNPGSLATAAQARPANLTILAIDNASYGSTGNQPTLTGVCVDLEVVAQGFGIRDTARVSSEEDLLDALQASPSGPHFIHAVAFPGNAAVPNIPMGALEIKKKFQDFLRA